MPTYQFTAIDQTGQEVRDVVEAADEAEAASAVRGLGYHPTKIVEKKKRKAAAAKAKKGRSFAIGRVGGKKLALFTRQLSTLQDAGLPILRSLQILENMEKGGALKNALLDVCEDIEQGSSLSEAMGKSPKAFDRLYVNMVKAGEAGGVLEIVLRRLAEFSEKAESLKRKVKGAMIYPIVVILVAVGILTFIMISIVPKFVEIFAEFDIELPAVTLALMNLSNWMVSNWFFIPLLPIGIWLWVKLVTKFKIGRYGWDLFKLQTPVMGMIIQKTVMARSSRTLGTLVASGVPILEALNITKETSGNAVYEQMYGRVIENVREGESVAGPMKDGARPGFNLAALFFWLNPAVWFGIFTYFIDPQIGMTVLGGAAGIGAMMYLIKFNGKIIDDIVVNMIDVGEETGELDKMLYKVADVYDEEVDVAVESLVSLLEPLMIVVLGGIVGFIVIALFMPLITLIQSMSG